MDQEQKERVLSKARELFGAVTFNHLIEFASSIRKGSKLKSRQYKLLSRLNRETGLIVETESDFIEIFEGATPIRQQQLWEQQPGRIRADPSRQRPSGMYSPLRQFYEDKSFTCRDCGKEEIWTAEQQQWWYEVAQGPVESKAIRCSSCRKAKRIREGKSPRE